MRYISKRVNSAKLFGRESIGASGSLQFKEIVKNIKVSRDFEELLEAISRCEDNTLDTLLQDTYTEYRDNYNFRDCKAELLDVIDEYRHTTRGKLESSMDQKFILGNGNSSTIEEIIEDIKVSKNFDELLQAISGCEDDILDTQLQDVYEECRDSYNIKTCKEMLLDVIDEYRHNWNM